MNPSRNSIATEAAFLVASLCFAGAAFAAPAAGTVTQLSGPLFAQKADGRTKVLAGGSVVNVGDTLVTGAETYAEVRFADNGTVTLQSDTRLAIEAFAFDKARAAGDKAELNLVEGGVKVVSGVIGARSPGRHLLKTTYGAIEVRDVIFIVQYAAGPDGKVAALPRVHLAALSFPVLAGGTLSDVSTEPLVIGQIALTTPVPGAKAPGLYVQVLDGIIHLTNGGGSQSFAAGQFGYTASFIQPPVVLPTNPGMQFTPPPSFSSTSTQSGSGANSGKSNTVDCEVR